MKKVWITALQKNEDNVKQLMETAHKYGLDADGHFWIDDLKNMAWMAAVTPLADPTVSLWVICGSKDDLTAEVRYGLVLLYLSVMKEKNGVNMIWIDNSTGIDPYALPSVFKHTDVFELSNPALGVKFAAKANIPPHQPSDEFRLQVHANPGFGVWFEVGPAKDLEWHGAMLAVEDGEIKAHGVGTCNKIPEKTVLEYPVQGLELTLAEKKMIGWAVQNDLSSDLSYYVKVDGLPKNIIFGNFAQEDDAEVHVLRISP